ncbi:MAG: biotin/lipoyl-binding protein, partial [Desulfobaccales bacterium]
MNVRKIIILLVGLLVLALAVGYIAVALRRSGAPPEIGSPPSLPASPLRSYGVIEPLGREVFLSAPESRRVTAVFVREGDLVKNGQPLLTLESDVEEKSLKVARLRVLEAQAKLAITQDALRRYENLAARKTAPEFEATKLRLQKVYEQQIVETAQGEVAQRAVELERLTLRSPFKGVVYKFDIRLGEFLTPEDYRKIILGSPDKQVRLFVEVFWRDRLYLGDKLLIKNAENLETIGVGEVTELAPYVGARDFRSEDPLERLDTKYMQVVVKLPPNIQAP